MRSDFSLNNNCVLWLSGRMHIEEQRLAELNESKTTKTERKTKKQKNLRVPYTQYGFLSVFYVSEGVPVRKKDEILD